MNAKPRVDIVIPVYWREAPTLAERVKSQVQFFEKNLTKYQWRIVIANNGMRKDAIYVAEKLAHDYAGIVTYTDVDPAGRGWSLRKTWLESTGDMVMYMDADLATNLSAVHEMLRRLQEGCDVVIGSRYAPGAKSIRTVHRLALSKGYNGLLRLFLRVHIRDAQCGFKGVRTEVARKIIPLVQDNEFFFDTELLVRAQQQGYKVCELPVSWQEQKETSVQLAKVSAKYIKNIFRVFLNR